MKKRILILASVCILILSGTAGAFAGVMEDVRSFLSMEDRDPWSMTAGLILQAYPSFGEKRIEQFNRLIQHLQMNIQKQPDQSSAVQIHVDGNEACSILISSGQQDLSARQTEQALTVFDLLDEGSAFLRDLPEKLPEACTVKTVRQKLKKGIAVKSVTMNIASGEDRQHPLSELITKTEYPVIKTILGGWVFQGKHKFTLLYDEDGRLLKVNYTGRAGESAERIRNIRLEWRIFRSPDIIWDELTLRTPTVEGADRDNWVLARNQTTGDGEQALSFSFEYDQKTGNNKTGSKWEGSLSGGTGLSGEISYTRTAGNETEKMTFRPEMNVFNQKQIEGILEIIHVSSKIEKEHFSLLIHWAANSPENMEALKPLYRISSLHEAVSREVVADILRSILLHVPEEDLGYLKDDISDADWNGIMEEAARSENGDQ